MIDYNKTFLISMKLWKNKKSICLFNYKQIRNEGSFSFKYEKQQKNYLPYWLADPICFFLIKVTCGSTLVRTRLQQTIHFESTSLAPL